MTRLSTALPLNGSLIMYSPSPLSCCPGWDGLFIAPHHTCHSPAHLWDFTRKEKQQFAHFVGNLFFPLLRLFNFPKRSGNCVGLTSSKATTFWLPHNQWTESALEAVLILLHAYTELGMTLSCGFGLGGLDY